MCLPKAGRVKVYRGLGIHDVTMAQLVASPVAVPLLQRC